MILFMAINLELNTHENNVVKKDFFAMYKIIVRSLINASALTSQKEEGSEFAL